MNGKTTYNLFDSFAALKGIITFCLLLFMTAKPVINTFFHIAGIEYELCESYEEKESNEKESKESKEKENSNDSEEDLKHYYNIPDCAYHSNDKHSLFVLQKDLMGSHLDIPVPPPDWG